MVGLSKMIIEKFITAGTIWVIDIMSMVIHAFIQSLASLTDIDQPTESTLNTIDCIGSCTVQIIMTSSIISFLGKITLKG